MRRGGSALWLAPPLVAVAAFALLLAFSLVRMIHVENDMRVDAEQNMLWVMHQSEVAARRLSETALLAELDKAEAGELALRFDILRSRFLLLNDGPQRRFVDRIGLGEDLDKLTALLDRIEPQATAPPQEGAQGLHAALAPFAQFFARAANKSMIVEWNELGGRLETYRDQLRKTIVALIGIMLVGGVLTAALFLALRHSRQRNRMLRQARDFSGLLIASSGEGIAAVDSAGNCTLWNEAMADMVGRPAQQAIGRPLSDLAGFFDLAPIRTGVARALGGDSTQLRLQPLFRAQDAPPLHVDLRVYPMLDEESIVGAILFLHDASDRHAAQRKDAETRERLEQLVGERTRKLNDALQRERSATDLYRNFAAMISHQFRTPLAVADSALQRLLRRGERANPDEVAERATRARSAIAGLTRLVESTLDAARIESGQIDARRESCDMAALLHTVCDQQRAAAPDARIQVAAERGMIALCDPVHVEQVLKNLISNAVCYAAPQTGVTVTMGRDGGQVVCDVHNAGTPIAEADRPRIFERNFRGANSVGAPGTGVGLFIARTLARMQGGDVVLRPCDSGTIFRLSLPRPESEAS